MFTVQVASLSILLILPQVVSLNHFGSRMKHSCLRIDGEVVCKEISRSFYNLWRLNCVAELLCRVAILNPFQVISPLESE